VVNHGFSFLMVGDDCVLPFATVGDLTIVTPSSAEPSSEETVPGVAMLCLENG
jgi:hypothetical protein